MESFIKACFLYPIALILVPMIIVSLAGKHPKIIGDLLSSKHPLILSSYIVYAIACFYFIEKISRTVAKKSEDKQL